MFTFLFEQLAIESDVTILLCNGYNPSKDFLNSLYEKFRLEKKAIELLVLDSDSTDDVCDKLDEWEFEYNRLGVS